MFRFILHGLVLYLDKSISSRCTIHGHRNPRRQRILTMPVNTETIWEFQEIQKRIERLLAEIAESHQIVNQHQTKVRIMSAQIRVLEELLGAFEARFRQKEDTVATNGIPRSEVVNGAPTANGEGAQTATEPHSAKPARTYGPVPPGLRTRPTRAVLNLLELFPEGLASTQIVARLLPEVVSDAVDKRRLLHQTIVNLNRRQLIERDAEGIYRKVGTNGTVHESRQWAFEMAPEEQAKAAGAEVGANA
jgi:hypothetical protein